MKRLTILLVTLLAIGFQLMAQNVKRPDSYNYNRGIECLRDGLYRDAYDYFSKELEENPKNGYAYAWAGLILSNSEMYGDALSSLDKALRYVPSKDNEFVSSIYRIKCDVYIALEEYDEALSSISKAIKATPKDEEAYEDRAEFYYNRNDYDMSDKDYDKIIELNPSSVMGYMGKGRNAMMQGKYGESIQYFDKVVKLYGKDYSSGYSFRAESYAMMGRYAESMDDVLSALSIDRDDKAFHVMADVLADSAFTTVISKLKIQQLKESNNYYWPYCVGIVYESQKQYEKAIEYYLKSNMLNASDIVYNRVSNCYELLGNYPMALQYIEDAIQMNPSYIFYRLFKANYEYENGNVDDALKDIDACISDSPEYAHFYYRKGFFENNSGKTEEAIDDYSTAIMLDPVYFHSYLERGDMYKRKGMMDLARKDYQKVVKLDSIPTPESRAQYALYELGRKDESIAFMDSIIAKYTDDGNIYYEATCLYSRMGEYAKAVEYLRTGFEKGFTYTSHIDNDDDLDPLRAREDFQNVVNEYKNKSIDNNECVIDLHEEMVTEIPFIKANGVTEVQCSINGLPLHFVFDTGASDVTISMVEATFMLKNKYLSPMDIIGKQNYLTADGNVCEGTVINLKSVKVGELELTNVRASVVKSQNAPLLLGQSVLGRLGKIEIDNKERVMKIVH